MNFQYEESRQKLSLHYFLVLIFFLSLALFCDVMAAVALSDDAAGGPVVSLSKTELPARGRQESILTVSRFGRYAVIVKSEQGTGLQLVDYMTGPGDIVGNAGERDGRLDLFLEKGSYKIITHGDERASGIARLEAHPFNEKNSPQPPAIVKHKIIESNLNDFEQVSYWLEIKSRQQVALEAAGRNLSDLRLWKDGRWLVDISPSISVSQPKTGQPLRNCRMTADLEPGLYLISAYGGTPLPWDHDNEASPLYLRYGIAELGSATRSRFTVSPFGVDRFIAPGASTYFRLELPKAAEASIRVNWLDESNAFNDSGEKKSIMKNSALPVAELQVSGSNEKRHIVSITAEPGSPYIFQHFQISYAYNFQGSGNYWISSVHSTHPQDTIDATAVMTSGYDVYRTRPILAQTIALDQSAGYLRRANLLGTMTLFLKVNAAGSYQVAAKGVDARFFVEPFFTSRPSNYARPAPRSGEYTFDLDAGYYVLTVEPVKAGIIDLSIRPITMTGALLETLHLNQEAAVDSVRAAVRFPNVLLDNNTWYTMYMNSQPEVKAGIVIRKLPLDLTDPLPISQTPEETVSVSVQTSEDGKITAEAEDGSFMDVSVDNGLWQKRFNVKAGQHTVSVRSTAKDTINYSLKFEKQSLNPTTPLPAISQAALDSLPDFAVLTDSSPLFFDLERNSSSTFIIRAQAPGLYHIQSTGLLSTGGNLRSRITPSFVKETGNGSGRNFSIRQYLREGDYQITVESNGLSKGHLGLNMKRADIIQGGFLTNRIPAHITLPAGTSVAYQFVITSPGEYHLGAVSLEKAMKCRLEDKDGWPIEAPNIKADITRRFEKGRYRMILLPETTDVRIAAVIEQTPVTKHFKGHGPHRLALATTVDHTWQEPKSGKEREADKWSFDMPATADVEIELTSEMQGDVVRINNDKTTSHIAIIPPARGWKGSLPAGAYRIDVMATRVNNQLPYRVGVRPVQLMAGMSRTINVPATVPVSVGQDGLIELSSFGGVDVKAQLMSKDGVLIASNDDRPDDWNFHIFANVKSGDYWLAVEPVGTQYGSTTITVRVPNEEIGSPITLPANTNIKLARSVKIFPIRLPASGDLLAVSAKALENVSLTFEVLENGGWRTVGSSFGRNAHLEIPLHEPGAKSTGSDYRLRLSSMDRRDTVAELSASLISSRLFSEADLKKGITLSSSAGLATAVVKLERDGLLRIPEEYRALRWSADALSSCEETTGNFLAVKSGYVWIAAEAAQGQTSQGVIASAERVVLGSGMDKSIQIRLSDNEKTDCDIAALTGGPVLLTATSRTGRPAIEFIEQGNTAPVNTDAMVIGEHGALTVSLNPKKSAARVWSASRSNGPFEARLAQISFNKPELIALPDGWSGAIEGIKANLYELPKDDKAVRLSLGQALVAVFLKDERIASVHWAEGNSFTEAFESNAERMLLLHTREGDDRFAIEMTPVSGALKIGPITSGRPYEKIMLNSGRLRLKVAPGKSPEDDFRALHVRGAAAEPVFMDMTGNVLSGKEMRIGRQGGTLSIEHEQGALLSWLDRPGEEAQDLWMRHDKPDAAPVTLPASVTLDGSVRSYRINTGKPVMLHVRSATPLATYMERGDKAPEVEVYSAGVVLDAYLPTGSAELSLRAFSGGNMSGSVNIFATPVIPTGEGLGPEILLAPGGARLFSFKVERQGSVGVGVKTDSDIVGVEILDSLGHVLGTGSAQMLNLKPGAYLMKLKLADNSAPVRVRPALLGLRVPDAGPPDDEIRRYIFSDVEMPQAFSSRRINTYETESGGEAAPYQETDSVSEPETGEGD